MKKEISSKKKHIFVGVAWPYVNGDLHPGHLGGYLLPADIFSRYHRLRGNDVLMVSGSDCHGTPITLEADKRNESPSKIVEKYHRKDIELFKLYNLDYNLYTNTTTKNHKKTVQDVFMSLLKKGYISKGVAQQYYSPKEKKFLPDRYVEGECPYCHKCGQRSDQCEFCGRWLKNGELIDPKGKIHKEKVILKETEHYFFDLDKLNEKIEKYIKSKKDIWKKWVWNESLGWIKEGLRKRAITRDLDWGVEIPIEEIKKLPGEKQVSNIESKRIYVWFEAVIGYLSASVEWSETDNSSENNIFKKLSWQDSDWRSWWLNENSEHYYFMGQDNLIFHTIMWPGQLLAMEKNYTLPTNVVVNKFMNFEGEKFSKSKNWTINSAQLAKDYGIDEIRFYISRILPENKTSNFSLDSLKEVINTELIAILGNFINRSLKFLENKFDGKMSYNDYVPSKEVETAVKETFEKEGKALESCQFDKGLRAIMKLAEFGNQHIDRVKLWKIGKKELTKKDKIVLLDIFNIVQNLSHLIHPYLPNASASLRQQLSDVSDLETGEDIWIPRFKKHLQLHGEIQPLFKKIN